MALVVLVGCLNAEGLGCSSPLQAALAEKLHTKALQQEPLGVPRSVLFGRRTGVDLMSPRGEEMEKNSPWFLEGTLAEV